MHTEDVDVLVIGGGPAGSTYAATVARAGFRVRVVEGKNFPRHHIGESLLAASMPLLRDVGVLPRLESANFLPKTGSLFVWNHHEIGLAMPAPARAFQVPRAEFDRILLDHARDNGAAVWEGQWVRSVRPGAASGGSLVTSNGDHGEWTHRARYVIDASGLFQFLPKRGGLPIRIIGPARVAVSGYYTGAGRLDGFHSTNVISEATTDGWLWFIPLTEDLTSVGFVGDGVDLTDDPGEHLAAQIAASTVVRDLLSTAEPDRRPRLLRYTNHIVDADLWRDGQIIVGDSAFFVDPLFSTGVHGGLFSGTMAACATVSVLSGEVDDAVAADWYDREVRRHHSRIQHTIDLLYGIHPGKSRFWRSRDASTMSTVDAERFAEGLGALGVDLFRKTFYRALLPIPEALQPLLDEFKGDPRLTPPPDDLEEIELAPEVEIRRDQTRRGDRIVPSAVVAHRRNRLFPVSVADDQPAAEIVGLLSTGPVRRSAWQHDDRLAGFVGLLTTAELIRPVQVLVGSR